MSEIHKDKKLNKINKEKQLAKKKARKEFFKQMIPLLIAVGLWVITLLVIHHPSIEEKVLNFFVSFTLHAAVIFGKMLLIPIESNSFPNLTVSGFTMKVVMECTAYNFYIFVIYLSLLSPVSWKQKLYTLLIFLGAVFVVNNLRFISMGYIGKYSAHMFDYVHDYLWNILFGFMVFLIWAWRYNKVHVSGNDKDRKQYSK